MTDNPDRLSALSHRTIRDFGAQWLRFDCDTGYYGSEELLSSITDPFITADDLKGKYVADIGSGTGRIVNQLIAAGAAKVLALEPSAAFEVLARNTRAHADRVILSRASGDALLAQDELDYVVSIGVIHHIPDPAPTLIACFRALKPGGRMLIWVYGKEGNEIYLFFILPLRFLTARMPAGLLHAFCVLMSPFLWLYIGLSRFLPLPMREYARGVLSKLSFRQLVLNIYDQLKPAYAKYYSKGEVRDLLARAGFSDIEVKSRHGYSWTAIGTKIGDK